MCALAGAGGAAQAQPVNTQQPPVVLERVTRDRWVHADQHPGFVPFDSNSTATHIRATISTALNGTRNLMTRAAQGLQARLSLDLTNRLRNATVDQPPVSYSQYEDARGQAEMRRRRLHGTGETIELPLARVWEIPFVMPPAPLRVGLTWSDTVSLFTETEGISQSLSGIRRNEVVGDTVIDGRSLPIVRTQADLTIRSRDMTTDYALEELFEITRDVSGQFTGWAAIDTAIGVRAAGRDSTVMTGTAVLRTGDGRSFTSPVRYERTRTWLLRDSVLWAQRQDSLRAQARRQDTGMLILPRTTLEERLLANDAALIDSLFARWRVTDNPNERAAIRALLVRSARGSTPGVEERLRALRVEIGDTSGARLESMQALGQPRYSIELLPYLNDLGRLWRSGFVPRFTYSELGNHLRRATPILEPDSTRWACAPSVCQAIIAQATSAREPRLRDAALAGAFAREPARWYDRLVARADSGSLIARSTLQLAQGVGATWPAAPKIPMPEPGADWRRWLVWMGNQVRFEESHINALRMYAARTNRNPIDELRQGWPPADDSARLVIGTILRGMRALGDPTPDELATALLSGPDADRIAARRQLDEMMRRNARPANDSVRIELLLPLLDSLSRGADAPWPGQPAGAPMPNGRRIHPWAIDFHGISDVPVFILDAELPAFLTSTLPSRFTLITRRAWDARPQRDGGVLISFQPTRQWDRFVSIGWSWTVFQRRAANEAPSGYAGGGSLVLLRTPDGWRVVGVGAWIT
jgi:hypothetical protein